MIDFLVQMADFLAEFVQSSRQMNARKDSGAKRMRYDLTRFFFARGATNKMELHTSTIQISGEK